MAAQHNVLAALAVAVAPVFAFAGGWEPDILGWIPGDSQWAQDLQTNPEPLSIIEATYAPPPQAEWCDSSNPYTPTTLECDDYHADLDTWVLDFLDTSTPPQFEAPPSFCGC